MTVKKYHWGFKAKTKDGSGYTLTWSELHSSKVKVKMKIPLKPYIHDPDATIDDKVIDDILNDIYKVLENRIPEKKP